MSGPIDAARARLAIALITGEDTSPHRAAIARLEAAARAAEERRTADAVVDQDQRAAAVRTRAGAIADEMQTRVDAVLAQHPRPVDQDACLLLQPLPFPGVAK